MRKVRAQADERRLRSLDDRLRDALQRPATRAAIIVEGDAARCAALGVAMRPLGALSIVWAPGDIWTSLLAHPARLVVFGDEPARLCDFAAPRRLRRIAPDVSLMMVSTRDVDPARAALFDAVVTSAAELGDWCLRRIRGH